MVALPSRIPAYSLPAGDVIQRRINNKYDLKRKAAHQQDRRVPMASYPVMPWLLNQEALVSAVLAGKRRVVSQQEALDYERGEKSQPAPQYAHPAYHVYHFDSGELPYTLLGNALWRVVSVVGNLYDCFLAAWRYSH